MTTTTTVFINEKIKHAYDKPKNEKRNREL